MTKVDENENLFQILSAIVDQRFEFVKRLGSGSFGEVFLAKDRSTNRFCAIKTERSQTKHPQLRIEEKIFFQIQNCVGFPSMIFFSEEKDWIFLVMDLLGPSLEDLFNFCQRKFSKKTVLMLIDQAISRVQLLHDRSLIHRDLKPENFLMGVGKTANLLHLIDFGLCKQFRDPQTHEHIPLIKGKSLIGTARYASLFTHQGFEQSRRDDLESLMYILIYLSRGDLPWMGLKANNKRKKYELIAAKKQNTSPQDLFRHLPHEYLNIYIYIRSLKFDETPDYAYLHRQIRSLFVKYHYEFDYVYDWFYVGKRLSSILNDEK